MKQLAYSGLIFSLLLLFSCSAGEKDKKGTINDLKVKIKELRDQKIKLDESIRKSEEELFKLDPASKPEKTKLVSIMPLALQNFTHYIDLQGRVESENIYYVAPKNGMGGVVTALYVRKGDFVQKGKLLMKLDDAVLRRQIEITKTQLATAKNVYQRTKNLWDQNIGTEVQVITARTNVDVLENTISAQQEQLKTFLVYSEVSGVAEEVNVRLGEFFQGAGPTGPQIRIVNPGSLKVVIDIPENYLSRVRKGTSVEIFFPDVNKRVSSSISFIGSIIGPNTRGFTAECGIPGGGVNPNQVAMVRLLDYSAANTIIVPVNVVQSDEKGKYVFVAEKAGSKMVARKKPVNIGEMYDGMMEIKVGLAAGEQLITEGYQALYDNQPVTFAAK